MVNWLQERFGPRPVEDWDTEEELEEHRRERKRLSENHYLRAQALTAWLLATLVAVNGAALATDFVKKNEALPFVIGVVLAILSGFSTWQESQDRNGLHYLESLKPKNISETGKKNLVTWTWRSGLMKRLAKILNWSSLGAFIVGCWLIA